MSAPTATSSTAASNAEAAVDDPAYVFHSWSAQALIDPLPIAGGEGAWFWDHEGNRYLDGSSQLVNLNLGHQHPAIVEAIKAQADRLCTVAPTFASDVRGQAARMIVELRGKLPSVFTAGSAAFGSSDDNDVLEALRALGYNASEAAAAMAASAGNAGPSVEERIVAALQFLSSN